MTGEPINLTALRVWHDSPSLATVSLDKPTLFALIDAVEAARALHHNIMEEVGDDFHERCDALGEALERFTP